MVTHEEDVSSDGDAGTDNSSSKSVAESASLEHANPSVKNPTVNTHSLATALKDDGEEDEDADSSLYDVSMSADSDDEPAIIATPGHVQTEVSSDAHIPEPPSKKRRYSSDGDDSLLYLGDHLGDEVRKRLKGNDSTTNGTLPPKPRSKYTPHLPAEIWHLIFTFCSPKVLGSLLSVNKSFNSYLSSSLRIPVQPLSQPALKLLSPDEIWRISRKTFMTGVPGPLLGRTELEMWQLACGRVCQFCGKRSHDNSKLLRDQWHTGPGELGIVPVWVFGIRTCGVCLKERSIKAGQHPPSVQITKHFSNQHVEDIKLEFEEVKKLGTAAAEEWLKGLDGVGKERKADAGRWERWEGSGGLSKMRSKILDAMVKPDASSSAPSHKVVFPPSVPGLQVPHSVSGLPPHWLPQNVPTSQTQPQPTYLPISQPPRFDSPVQSGPQNFPPRGQNPSKQERTKEQVAELKAARRAEIERRCMLLEPPLTAEVLAHMASFQAAIQIIQPLTDSTWEVLKPRLLSQRDDAERREKDRLIQVRHIQEQTKVSPTEHSGGDPKGPVEGDWDDVQGPVRTRIGGYADEIIRDGWNTGEKVNFESAPLFAAEVLIYVRKRFYAEVAKDEAALRAAGREPELDPPNGPYTKKLILENMKWVFDSKIKPITELHRKELFLCNACDFPTKYYGFEGIIQHFAAKHTNSLSIGSIVVHWKSEWPQHPPFNPDPNSLKPGQTSGSTNRAGPNNRPGSAQIAYGFGGYPPPAGHPYPLQQPPYQPSPGPYYGHPQYEQYTRHAHGPYAPPQYPPGSQPYQATPYASTQQGANGYDPLITYPQQATVVPYAAPHNITYSTTGPNQSYPPSPYDASSQAAYISQATQQYGAPNQQPAAGFEATTMPQPSDLYRTQLHQLAQDARDIWYGLTGLKEVPGSAKVYTVIYHLLRKFRDTFQEDPPLSMLVDGLNNNKDMRPVRNVNGLVCKACSMGLPGASNVSSDKKHFSFPQLVNHFYTVHEGVVRSGISPVPDWTKDMVELPEARKLQSIPHARGMDDQKLKLLGEALPEIFTVPAASHYDQYESEMVPQQADLAPSQDNHERYYASSSASRPPESSGFNHEIDEYDPRNPRDAIIDSRPRHRSSLTRRSTVDESHFERQPTYQRLRQEGLRVESSYPDGRGRGYEDEAIRYVNGEVVTYRDPRSSRANGLQRDKTLPQQLSYDRETGQALHVHREGLTTSKTNIESPRQKIPGHAPGPSAPEQDRILDVVAQLPRQTRAPQGQETASRDRNDAGSEDGEVRSVRRPTPRIVERVEDSRTAVERFLEEFRPGETTSSQRIGADQDNSDIARQPADSDLRREQQHTRRRIIYDERAPVQGVNARYISHDEEFENARLVHRGPSYQLHGSQSDERYITSHPGWLIQRERSPELVDRRYKLNDVVYREERHPSARRTPSRYARYESVRLENDRAAARSRSPIYVQDATESHYRGPSPFAREPTYRARSPLDVEERQIYDRGHPRQEIYRVYTENPRAREQRYEEVYEYVRVADPQGDYMIRRPVRRQVEPVYVDERYEDEVYVRERQPIYEGRPRQEVPPTQQALEDEYDPRHPEPVANAGMQRVRYH